MLVHAEADRLVTGFSLDPYVCQRAKLSSNVTMILVAMASAVALSACADEGRMTPVYDPVTRDLIRLDYDVNSDGRVDVRTFMASGRPVRLEGDQDGDGRLDRWEYYDQNERLIKLGTSTGRWATEAAAARLVLRLEPLDRLVRTTGQPCDTLTCAGIRRRRVR